MGSRSFKKLSDMLVHHPVFQSNSNNGQKHPIFQLLATLRRLSYKYGSIPWTVLADVYKIGEGSIQKFTFTDRGIEAILSLRERYLS